MPFSCPSLSSLLPPPPSLSHRHLILFLYFICSRCLRKLQTQNMAACGSLDHIFDKPLPSEKKTPSFLDSLSQTPSFLDPLSQTPSFLDPLSPWKRGSAFTELFGGLHFSGNRVQSSPTESNSIAAVRSDSSDSNSISAVRSSPSDSNSICGGENCASDRGYYQRRQSASMNSESLSMCTEGLGFESFDDVDDMLKHDVCNEELGKKLGGNSEMENHRIETKVPTSRRRSGGTFPPPISCIGRSGKPWVCFKSYREDGRFILKEIRIPTQEFLHACRENGRLKLQFVQSDDEILDEEDDEEEEDDQEEQNVETRDCNFDGGS